MKNAFKLDKIRQKARIFKEAVFFEATYNTKINNQFTYLLPVGCLDASGRKRAKERLSYVRLVSRGKR